MKRSEWCRHFTGIQNKTCNIGIEYTSVRFKPAVGPYQWPCLMTGGTCEKFSAYTVAEIDHEERESKAAVEIMLRARAAINAVPGTSGSLPCPVCDYGLLKYSCAKNGHVHAACSTEGCVRWME